MIHTNDKQGQAKFRKMQARRQKGKRPQAGTKYAARWRWLFY